MSSVLLRAYAEFDDPDAFGRAREVMELLSGGEFEILVGRLGDEAVRLVEAEEHDSSSLGMASGELIEELEHLYADTYLDVDEVHRQLVVDVVGPGNLLPEPLFDYLGFLGAAQVKGAADFEEPAETVYYLDGEWYDAQEEVDWPDPQWLEE